MASIVLPSFNTDPNTGRTFSPRPANNSSVGGTFEYVGAYQGDEGLVLPFEEGASQTFKSGDLVILTAGVVTIATSPTLSTETILGFAMNDATGVEGFRCDVRVPRPSDIFTAAIVAGGTFASESSAGTLSGLSRPEPGVWVVNDTGDDVVMILTSQQFGPQGLEATAGGRVFVKFI